MAEFGLRGDGAVGGVVDDFGYRLGLGFGVRFGKVVAGDLEGVEDQARAARVELSGDDLLDDEADG